MSSSRQPESFNSSKFQSESTKQKQTEDYKDNKLNETNKLLCAILNNTTALVVNLDTEFNFIFVNKAYANACNLPMDFFFGKNHFELYPHEENQKIFQRVVDTKEPFYIKAKPFDDPNQPESGTKYWDWSLIPIKKENGEIESLVFTLEDVTKQVHTTLKLEEAKAIEKENTRILRNALIELSEKQFTIDQHAIVSITNLAGMIVYANEKFCKISQYSREELIGNNHRIVNSGFHSKDFFKDMYKSLKLGKVWKGEIRNKKKNGEYYWVATTIATLTNEEGKISYYFSIRTDITERKLMEEELKKSEDRFRSIFSQSPIGVALIESNTGKFIQINPKFCELLGYQEEEIQANYFLDITPEIMKLSLEPWNINLEEGAKIHSFQKRYDRRNGRSLWADLTCVPFFREEQNIHHHLLTAIDISETKQAEEILTKYMKELEILNHTKNKFFSIIAHDLRNPFAGIIGISELLHTKMNEEQITESFDIKKRYTELILESAKSAFTLLENLLQWAKAQTGEFKVKKEIISIKRITTNTLLLIKSNCVRKNITIEYDFCDIDEIYSDESLVSTILRNLLTNAVKFSHPGDRILVTTRQNGSFLEFSVTDRGVGLSTENIEKIFRIESKFSKTGTDNEKGSGLGLILCKEFTELLGGNISVKSEIGQGSRFTITLPL